jgi:hypothetical protein
MLKSSPIFRRSGAHLVKKKGCLKKNKDCPFLKLECFEHAKKNLLVSNFEHVNFSINEK